MIAEGALSLAFIESACSHIARRRGETFLTQSNLQWTIDGLIRDPLRHFWQPAESD